MEELEKKHLEFKKRSYILILLGKKLDGLFAEGKISKKKKKELEKKLIYEWHKNWNKHPYVSDSIKQAFNLLYC